MRYNDNLNLYSLINNSSLSINTLTNINFLKYKKNNKIIKFTLLSELIYMLIYQSNNYKYLYYNLISQLDLIKYKLLLRIDEILEKNKNKNIEKMIEKFSFSTENLISFIFLDEKNFLEMSLISLEIKDIKLLLNKDNLYIKYINIIKIRKYINKFIYTKLELLNSFFYKKIYFLLKREIHQEILEIILPKILKKYSTVNFNINISRQQFQEFLLELFMKSNILYPKFTLNHNFIKRKNMSIIYKDILCDAKNILNIYLKKNYNFSYFKYKNKIKINNISPLLINKLNNFSFNKLLIISNIFENEKLIFNSFKYNKIYNLKNEFYYKKNYYNIYILYYFFYDLFNKNNCFHNLINKLIYYINVNINIKNKFFQFIENEIENKIDNVMYLNHYLDFDEINKSLKNQNIDEINISDLEILLGIKINLNKKNIKELVENEINKNLNELKENLLFKIINFFINENIINSSTNELINIYEIIKNKLNLSELFNKLNIFKKNNYIFKLHLKKIKYIISKIYKTNEINKLKIISLYKNINIDNKLINYITNNINYNEIYNKSIIKIYNNFSNKEIITNFIDIFVIDNNIKKILYQYFQYNISIHYFNNLNVKKNFIENKDFFFRDKKINIFTNLLKLTKKNFSIIKKNKLFFLFYETTKSFNDVYVNLFDKIDSFNSLDNYNRIINKIIDYNTDEINKITKHTILYKMNENINKYIRR
jgi:hypothetical protein